MEINSLKTPCAAGLHKPSLSPAPDPCCNLCGICDHVIECDDPSKPWWATTEQTDAYCAEMAAEWDAELRAEEYEAMHPESRCPPRE